MNLLDNELVKKYFGCEEHPIIGIWKCGQCVGMSDRILTAMQEPIRRGDRFLDNYDENWRESIAKGDKKEFHPHWLRLPNRFQKPLTCREKYHPSEETCPNCTYPDQPKQECECYRDFPTHEPSGTCACSCHCKRCCKPASGKVEEKIDEEIENLKKELHAIVRGTSEEK